MANKKRHINNEEELITAMHYTGYCFPTNEFEQKASLKIQVDIDIDELSNSIDSEDIWNSKAPKEYKKVVVTKRLNPENEISMQWGIAAKGSANISEKTMDKIKKNQDKNK